MKLSRNALMVLGAGALVLAIAAIGWWLGSPDSVRRAGQALVMLVGAVYGVEQCRRLRLRSSPTMLFAALVGLAVPLLATQMGPLFPTVLAVSVAIAWTGVGLARCVTRPRERSAEL